MTPKTTLDAGSKSYLFKSLPILVQVMQDFVKMDFSDYPHVPLPVPIQQIKIKNKGFQNPETLSGLVPRAGIEPARHLSDTGF